MKSGNEMTNGDKIRSMDDEGLTQFFLKRQCKCCPARDICLENKDMSCHDKILQWLKQDYSGSKWLECKEDRFNAPESSTSCRKTEEKVENHEEKFQYKGWN